MFVITGAGCSTASGIPDYRDADGAWKRPPPIQLQAFLGSDRARRRYWARSMLGWPHFSRARPNGAHRGLARLQRAGVLSGLVTQNVDGLHQKAGHTGVIDLHGRIDRAVCMECEMVHPRAELQSWLEKRNPHLTSIAAAPAPDGDATLEGVEIGTVEIPDCTACGGMLKPDVVFFGESVPRGRVNAAYEKLKRSDAVLLVGTSVMVYSSFRFCRAARESAKPLAAVNRGRTRADAFLEFKIPGDCGAVIERLADALD